MKLFLWRGPEVLRNYSSGIAFSLADDVETARWLIRNTYQKYLEELYIDQEYVAEEMVKDLQFLSKEPEVFDGPVAFFKSGGE